jgi:hypothetical protein
VSYQWERCSLGVCAPVPDATGASYTAAATDLGASFYVVVTASNASGSTQATSWQTSGVQPAPTPAPAPAPSPGSATAPGPAPAPSAHPAALRLSHVAVVSRRGARALVFTLSARARVQIALSSGNRTHAQRRRGAAGVSRITVTGRKGTNHYTLSSLLRGHRLAPGRYTVTVRAGSRAVTVHLSVS